MAKKFHLVSFSVELKEKHFLENLAKHRGQSVSALMRDILNDSNILKTNMPDDMFHRHPYEAKKPKSNALDMFKEDCI